MNKPAKNTLFLALFAAFIIGGNLLYSHFNNQISDDAGEVIDRSSIPNLPEQLSSTFPEVDFGETLVDYEKVLWGGVRKDGIPALTNPKFDNLALVSQASGETLGALIEIDNEKRFYPFNILVSHEIVNDRIGETNFAVTFCPLCGSTIVFNADVGGESKEFGVSGFLFESNLIMYDRTETPSLWSQARGEAIIGDQAGTKLELIDFQLLNLDQVRQTHPDAKILSTDTGTGNSYERNPYGDYDQTESTLFPISIADTRHPAKEIFYIIPKDDISIAIKVTNLDSDTELSDADLGLTIAKNSAGEVSVMNEDGSSLPGYYEMWFSWAQHHQEKGNVWTLQ